MFGRWQALVQRARVLSRHCDLQTDHRAVDDASAYRHAVMTLPRGAADVLGRQVAFEVECIDRMHLNVYVP
jgi:hypothetical protein